MIHLVALIPFPTFRIFYCILSVQSHTDTISTPAKIPIASRFAQNSYDWYYCTLDTQTHVVSNHNMACMCRHCNYCTGQKGHIVNNALDFCSRASTGIKIGAIRLWKTQSMLCTASSPENEIWSHNRSPTPLSPTIINNIIATATFHGRRRVVITTFGLSNQHRK